MLHRPHDSHTSPPFGLQLQTIRFAPIPPARVCVHAQWVSVCPNKRKWQSATEHRMLHSCRSQISSQEYHVPCRLHNDPSSPVPSCDPFHHHFHQLTDTSSPPRLTLSLYNGTDRTFDLTHTALLAVVFTAVLLSFLCTLSPLVRGESRVGTTRVRSNAFLTPALTTVPSSFFSFIGRYSDQRYITTIRDSVAIGGTIWKPLPPQRDEKLTSSWRP